MSCCGDSASPTKSSCGCTASSSALKREDELLSKRCASTAVPKSLLLVFLAFEQKPEFSKSQFSCVFLPYKISIVECSQPVSSGASCVLVVRRCRFTGVAT
jgi:hypothetical protein